MPITPSLIPDDMYGRIHDLLRFAVVHRDRRDQVEARKGLRDALTEERTMDLPEALRVLARSRVRDINGRIIEAPKRHLARIAGGLAVEVEGWIEDQVGRVAA